MATKKVNETSYAMLQDSAFQPIYNYYIDPQGDTSIYTPGTSDAPFRSIYTAYDVLSTRQRPAHQAIFNVNPGTYPTESLQICPDLVARNLTIKAADPSNKPNLTFDYTDFIGATHLTLADLIINSNSDVILQQTFADLFNCCIKAGPTFSGKQLLYIRDGSIVVSNEGNVLDYSWVTMDWGIFIGVHATLMPVSTLTLVNAVQFNSAFIIVAEKSIYSAQVGSSLVYNPGVIGRRFIASSHGHIHTLSGGTEYFPGNIDGITDLGGTYYP
ncbi:MAG: hypothetical protein LIP23_10360 [Planctomycetes bacterium]|nr:hypothetical protein [Planctomycetota bacterium]